jgi:hypothetical protein
MGNVTQATFEAPSLQGQAVRDIAGSLGHGMFKGLLTRTGL